MDKTRSLIKSDSYSRRQVLIETMNGLETEEITCANCPGHCCTFVGNSMQMTTVEALDLYFYLVDNELWNEELEEKLKENIKEFRLDHRPSIGGGHFMRKTYTCPFFLFQSKALRVSMPAKHCARPFGVPRSSSPRKEPACPLEDGAPLQRWFLLTYNSLTACGHLSITSL